METQWKAQATLNKDFLTSYGNETTGGRENTMHTRSEVQRIGKNFFKVSLMSRMIYIYIHIVAKAKEFSENKVLNIVNVEL